MLVVQAIYLLPSPSQGCSLTHSISSGGTGIYMKALTIISTKIMIKYSRPNSSHNIRTIKEAIVTHPELSKHFLPKSTVLIIEGWKPSFFHERAYIEEEDEVQRYSLNGYFSDTENYGHGTFFGATIFHPNSEGYIERLYITTDEPYHKEFVLIDLTDEDLDKRKNDIESNLNNKKYPNSDD